MNPKKLFLFYLLLLTGCFWRIEGSHDHDGATTSFYYDMWLEDVDVYCEYDATEHWSRWTLVATANTTEGYNGIDEVYVDIAGAYSYTYVNSFRLTPSLDGTWSYSFQNYGWEGNSYYCGNSYDFEFAAYDDYGNYVTMWYYW